LLRRTAVRLSTPGRAPFLVPRRILAVGRRSGLLLLYRKLMGHASGVVGRVLSLRVEGEEFVACVSNAQRTAIYHVRSPDESGTRTRDAIVGESSEEHRCAA
jgi:hypothetical protein